MSCYTADASGSAAWLRTMTFSCFGIPCNSHSILIVDPAASAEIPRHLQGYHQACSFLMPCATTSPGCTMAGTLCWCARAGGLAKSAWAVRGKVGYDPSCTQAEEEFNKYTYTELALETKFWLIIMAAGAIPVIVVDHYVLGHHQVCSFLMPCATTSPSCTMAGVGYDPSCKQAEEEFNQYTYTELALETKFGPIVEGFGDHSFRSWLRAPSPSLSSTTTCCSTRTCSTGRRSAFAFPSTGSSSSSSPSPSKCTQRWSLPRSTCSAATTPGRGKMQVEGLAYDTPNETPHDVMQESVWCNTPAHRRKAAKDNAPM
ncbi:hypothetical protein PTSG_03881 [Salpingoeca rosetta]|uniref:Uncharacterized protein n=1 Tax=Salpingoeca rosetta (strain ATCC 50818 / BSB-021) TaxID=946362 RepID=F2U5N4_SALR5|nr:uncharacterized protein PTSG_03881 [Salpingoeca rosetta]EGD83250.1 hypothetical protein PTSG_03881 [Salpingoeca rosetta]|eukprot:XP_004995614.1 hypothetical protein PTSG_03881 [Salpingoeca rosetta]